MARPHIAVGIDAFKLWSVAMNVLSNCLGICFGLRRCK